MSPFKFASSVLRDTRRWGCRAGVRFTSPCDVKASEYQKSFCATLRDTFCKTPPAGVQFARKSLYDNILRHANRARQPISLSRSRWLVLCPLCLEGSPRSVAIWFSRRDAGEATAGACYDAIVLEPFTGLQAFTAAEQKSPCEHSAFLQSASLWAARPIVEASARS